MHFLVFALAKATSKLDQHNRGLWPICRRYDTIPFVAFRTVRLDLDPNIIIVDK